MTSCDLVVNDGPDSRIRLDRTLLDLAEKLKRTSFLVRSS